MKLTTDSKYVMQGITSWLTHGRETTGRQPKKPVKNVDLWQRLDSSVQKHRVNGVG